MASHPIQVHQVTRPSFRFVPYMVMPNSIAPLSDSFVPAATVPRAGLTLPGDLMCVPPGLWVDGGVGHRHFCRVHAWWCIGDVLDTSPANSPDSDDGTHGRFIA